MTKSNNWNCYGGLISWWLLKTANIINCITIHESFLHFTVHLRHIDPYHTTLYINYIKFFKYNNPETVKAMSCLTKSEAAWKMFHYDEETDSPIIDHQGK